MFDPLYKEEILEHYKSPQNFGKIELFDKSSKQLNPLCGDEIEIFVRFENGEVSDISFTGKGCAISMASASLLTEYVKNKSKNRLTKLTERDMLTLLGVEVSETRKKCAFLALSVLRDCL